MRLGLVWEPSANANYRAIEPLKAMTRRGHQVVWPLRPDGAAEARLLAGCDVVHVYRRTDKRTWRVLAGLAGVGTAIVYDNDDDFSAAPVEQARAFAGLGGQRATSATLRAALAADVFTTTSAVIADKYHRAGVERVEVIPNCPRGDAAEPVLCADTGLVLAWKTHSRPLRPRRPRSDGVVVGWVAGAEHYADVEGIGIVDALERLLASHEHVRVECIGVDLRLPEHYRHDANVHFDDLPARIGGFDVGIAPLADIPFNWARSDIKLKEYAASGVPWLASPIGPYVGLGEEQGGQLIPDDGWYQALERLVTSRRERRRLARNAARWAQDQAIDAVADRWEHVFAQAAGRE
jgi:glycosyltransferase involved in cell wall biosynthesis